MQTNFFSSFFAAKTAVQGAVDVQPSLCAPMELDLAALEHVAGGLGPNDNWATVAGPNDNW